MNKADRIYRELQNEHASIWFIADDYGHKIMVKARSNGIKSIINGCPLKIFFGKDNSHDLPILHNGVFIYDDDEHPIVISGTQLYEDEHLSLKYILQQESTFIHFHNELGVCIAIAKLSISEDEKLNVLGLIGDAKQLYIGSFNNTVTQSLDALQQSIGSGLNVVKHSHIDMAIIGVNLSDWVFMNNHFVGLNEQFSTDASDKNEGENFEKEIWVSLEGIFNHDIYKSPTIPYKKSTRELTDIFAVSDYGIFLIETKFASIYNVNPERSMERKVANQQKQITKAINQLKGGIKKIRDGIPVYDAKKNPIKFDRKILPHCIVVVSELLQFGEWDELIKNMFVTMYENPMILNVMDFKEFMKFIRASQGDRNKFDYFLLERRKGFIKHQNIFMETQFMFKK